MKIILPKRAAENLELDLVYLTKVLVKNKLAENVGGLLGGEFGYGTDFENNIFMIHHFCWCEKEGCKFCSGELPNFLHKKSGLEIRWYKWIGRDMEYNKKPDYEMWSEVFQDCLKSLKAQKK